ncbi:putative phage protein [Candidatus Hepatincola sp. Av]
MFNPQTINNIIGHGSLIILKSNSKQQYTIKFNALGMHPHSLNIDNEFGWTDVNNDSSKLSYTLKADNNESFQKQKFNPMNSKTTISIHGTLAPFMYLALDKLIVKQADPFDTLKLLRLLGLQGVKFNAYDESLNNYGSWILKSLTWHETNFQYAATPAKIEFFAKFNINLGEKQYEQDTVTLPESLVSAYPVTYWR